MYDYLIIGHGLAGAILSYKLLKSGQKVAVIDEPGGNHSSVVAAGIFNPITGRKMFKTWRAEEIFAVLTDFYTGYQMELDVQFYHPIGLYRPYASIEDQNDWEGKKSDDKFTKFIDYASTTPISSHDLHDKFGGLFLKPAGYVNIVKLLDANKRLLLDKGCYHEMMFYEQELKNHKDHYSFGNLQFRKIIFCNGIAANASVYFDWLPFQPVKGEILDVEMDHRPETIYNRGVFILPFESNQIKVGSTYQNRFEDLEPTTEGQNELKEKLGTLLNEGYKITGHRAGIRPATKDRKPFIGKHPDNEHIYIFNGFGSKGVSLIPYCSEWFVKYLLDGEALDAEIDIARYYSHFPTKPQS